MVRRFSELHENSTDDESYLDSDHIIELLEIGIGLFRREVGDLLNEAFNHPAGTAVEVLLNLLPPEGIPEDIEMLLRKLLPDESNENGCTPAELYLAFNLSRLHATAPDWTQENVVVLLDWDRATKARGAWSAFLMSPRITPALWDLRKHFLDACSNYQKYTHKERVSRQHPRSRLFERPAA